MLSKLASKKYLLEEFIVQHPEMARINPSSVNTIRVMTALDKNESAVIIGACLRAGGPNCFVDNFHSGGVAYPIDLDLGMVTSAGKNNTSLDRYTVHPSTGVAMIGFKVPHWADIMEQTIKAANKIPEIPIIGWDIAITQDGIEFVEANIGADPTVVQLDHVGKMALVKDALKTI